MVFEHVWTCLALNIFDVHVICHGKGSGVGSLFCQEKHYSPHLSAWVPPANFEGSMLPHTNAQLAHLIVQQGLSLFNFVPQPLNLNKP